MKFQKLTMCLKTHRLLWNKVLQNIINQEDYELFGFVYKIQGFEFSNNEEFDLSRLNKAELISKAPHFNSLVRKNQFGINEVGNSSINISNITVFRIPDPNGRFLF